MRVCAFARQSVRASKRRMPGGLQERVGLPCQRRAARRKEKETMKQFNKKLLAIAISTAALAGVLALAGCGSSSSDSTASGDSKTITVAASPTPHAEILNNAVKPILEKEGYTLVVKEFTDYVLPNTATEEGEVDANYFQHKPYLDSFNEEQGTHLVSVEAVHFEPFGLYAGKTASLDALGDGAVVAVPNDTTNEARALLLLEQEGLITLKDGAGITATTNDIESNPKNLQIKELESAAIPTVLADVDVACINGNYAQGAGLNVADALAVEASDSLAAETYGNVLVVKDGNQNNEAIQALAKALVSEDVRTYINNTYGNAVVPVF